MERIECDILIAGGGIAGLTATAALAACGFDVLCVDPGPPPAPGGPEADLRSTAFLEPSIDLLREAGLWDRLEPFATDLVTMRLADAGGQEAEIRESVDFTAADLGRARFGCNLPNAILRHEMAAALDTIPGARLLTGDGVAEVTPRLRDVRARLNGGDMVSCRLVVAADGRDSDLRSAAGIGVRTWRYGQQALVFAVSHPLPHRNVSIEVHRTGGPFTLVPLPDREGIPHSAVVWMEPGPRAQDLMAMGADAFSHAATTRSCSVLGPLTLASPRAAWPIISRLAHRLDGQRLALIAEAGHVVPPIGAQGLNMSLADIRCLRDVVTEARDAGRDIGEATLLATYNRRRHADIAARVLGVHALNRAAMAEAPVLRDLRRRGLEILARPGPFRNLAMRAGLGA